jgi:hypothetical protein
MLPDPQMVSGMVQDYFLHGFTFAVLSLVGWGAYPRLDRAILWAMLTVFGGAIELFQALPAIHRDADWHDWLVDLTVAAVVLAVMPPSPRIGKAVRK